MVYPRLRYRSFLQIFESLVDMKDEYIYLPRNLTKLKSVNKDYNAAGLPSCVGSMDVVHVKWSHCPTGDHNCAKGKEWVSHHGGFSALQILIGG